MSDHFPALAPCAYAVIPLLIVIVLFLYCRTHFPLRILHAYFTKMRRGRPEEGEHYRTLVAHAPDIVLTLSPDGTFRSLNAAFEIITGWPGEEWVGRPFEDILHPDDLPQAFERFRHILQGGSPRLSELRIRTESGEYKVMGVIGSLMVEHGSAVGIMVIARDMTERKRLEDDLKEREALLRTVIDTSPDPIFLKDREGRLLLANKATLQVLGMSAEEVIGRRDAEMCTDAEGGCIITGNDQKVMREGVTQVFEEIISTPRCTRAFLVTKTPRHDKEENVVGLVGVACDITERKRAEDALRTSEAKYRSLFTHMINGFAYHQILCDMEGMPVDFLFLEVNDAFEKLTGLAQKDIIGRRVTQVLPGIKNEAFDWIGAYGEVALTGNTIQFERYSESLGKWYSVSAYSPQRGYFVTILHDITRRKMMEESLRESEERFRQLFEQNDDAIVIFSPEPFKILDVNLSATALYGYSKEDFITYGPGLFTVPEELEQFKQAILARNGEGGVTLEKQTTIRSDGKRILTSIRGKHIRINDQEVIYCSFRDITGKVRLEEEKKFYHAKLIQANKMTSLGMLASGVAHEINNPNNFIMFNSQLLSSFWQDAVKLLDQYYRENGDFQLGGLPFSEVHTIVPKLLNAVSEGSRRIRDITDNLSGFTRSSAPGVESLVNVNEVVKASISVVHNQIVKFTDTFHNSYRDDLPPVRGNAQQLEQVLINLIMNALQALPDKQCGVSVATGVCETGESVIISVRDEGAGMPPEIIERMFEPFFTTKLDRGGTGLGLYISSSIIKDHNGTLGFTSEPGKGTTATITLPVVGARRDDEAA